MTDNRFKPRTVTADEAHGYRTATGVSIEQAKRRLQNQAETEALAALRRDGSAWEKVDWLLDRYEERFLHDR